MVFNVGLIGLGYWGKHYIRIINSNNKVNLQCICDLNEDALQEYKHLNINSYTDYHDMINNENLNAIVIVTIAKTHYNIILDVLKYNIKIFVEKPYTINYNLCLKLNNLIDDKKSLMVGHTYLFNKKIEYIKNIIDKKSLDIKTINFEWCCYGPIRKDTTPIFDLAVHPLSILLYIFPNNMVDEINCIKSDSGNTYFVQFKFNEIIVQMNISWSSPGKNRTMTINTDEMKIVFDDVSNTSPIKIYNINNPNYDSFGPNIIHSDGNIVIPQIENLEPLTEQFNHWLDTIFNDRQCISDNIFGTKVVKISEDIEKKSLQLSGNICGVHECAFNR